MNWDQIIPAIFMIAVLILVLPSFLRTNSKLKLFLTNLSIWAIIVSVVMIVLYFIFWMKKINLAITGCMGRMGQQFIKSAKSDKNFKLVALTENRIINKKISGIKPELNTEKAFKNTNVIIDFTVPKCTIEVLKIASKLKKRVVIGTTGFTKKEENLI